MDAAAVAERISGWMADEVRRAGARGLVVGLSGGVDSATVAALAVRAVGRERVLGLVMPCHSDPADARFARLAAEPLGIEVLTVDLSHAYDALVAVMSPEGEGTEVRRLALANLKPRLRMAALYFHAALRRYLVAGTGNRDELYVGYFTKYGDGGVDLLPIGSLVKGQVRELARHLGVPPEIVDRTPTAGLWPGQTDEGQMGIRYADLDRYLLTGEGSPELKERVEAMHRESEHKRQLPPVGPA
ncbi:NAD(+) synthase [Caldinitratiruptor microaerophilus]|uniref:NH(3)-dependent NAD(+) synthetase n=1 Tax=Caldinitratiruptor microaerophilus TaxID=671077 RepID=A0AA35G8U9_9FIRM|nr:NAD(+) synthase [Caldinitratiruptor microaerophilus]BDG60813.1 NH(3)-dependent NAD(+) synthetase [Caldinitratiruptor microaerophilus]